MPPRGPRSVLCVVVVTICAYPTGVGCSPAATKPAKCAMSTRSRSPTREVEDARVRGRAGDDELRTILLRETLELVVVEHLVVLADSVRSEVVELAGEIHRRSVRQVTALVESEAEHRVAGLKDRRVGGHVRLCARMRLHVRVRRADD